MKNLLINRIIVCTLAMTFLIVTNAGSYAQNKEELNDLMLLVGNAETVRALLEKGADVNAKTNKGSTALMFAAAYGYEDSIRVLLNYKADINAKNNKGQTALMLAVRYFQGDAELVLLDRGADVNLKDNHGMTAFMWASQRGDSYLGYILGRGADVNAKDNDGATALMKAAQMGKTDAVKILLGKDNSFKVIKFLEWLIIFALLLGAIYMTILDSRGKDWFSSLKILMKWILVGIFLWFLVLGLVWCKTSRRFRVLPPSHKDRSALFYRGPDVNAKDNKGNTALSLALKNGHKESADLLRQVGAKE